MFNGGAVNNDPNGTTKRNQLIILGTALIGICGLVMAGMFLFDGKPPIPREKAKAVSITPPGTVDDRDVWRANEAARAKDNDKQLVEIQGKLRTQEEANTKLVKEVEELKRAKVVPVSVPHAAILSAPLGTTTQPQRVLSSPAFIPVSAQPGPPPVVSLNAPLNGPSEPKPDAVEMITFAPVANGSKQAADKTASSFIPAASFVRVVMLNGVDSNTGGQGQGDPLPIAFQVLDDANLANKYKLDIKDCRFIASSWGNLSTERTMVRTESLTCILDGEALEIPIKGVVIGGDGKDGIRGRLVTKQGQLLANALFAGSLSGIGKAIQTASSTTSIGGGGITQTVDPSQVAQAGIGGGVGSAAKSLADYYIKQADKLFPTLETDSGQIVEILITKGASYTGKAARLASYISLLRRDTSNSRDNDD